jgi:glucose/arabinose dehydrogenase
MPVLHDGALSLELVAEGLKFPTSMRFISGPDNNSLLVLQKNDGQVRLVSGDGWRLADRPVRQVHVENQQEQGLLGIAANGSDVYLYMTQNTTAGVTKNRIYKYNYDAARQALVNETLLLELPGMPGPFHNGGKIAIGPRDDRLYAVIGDTAAGGGVLDNEVDAAVARPPDDKSVVLRVDRNTGAPASDNPFYGDDERLARYYAYGIRNSFGMDFDPLTGTLWMTENGPDSYDEINVVRPGFNSGWHKVMGPIARTNVTAASGDLVLFRRAYYGDPAFSWQLPVGVTDIEFLKSDKLGERYKDNIFVGDINNGRLYFFTVNSTRTGLQLEDKAGLSDLVADTAALPSSSGRGGSAVTDDLSPVILGEGFGRITDIETGPDGYLYILTYAEDGRIYRIR